MTVMRAGVAFPIKVLSLQIILLTVCWTYLTRQTVNGGENPPVPCERGHYCPAMATGSDKLPCPPGTFTNRSDLTDASECTPCTPGYYCTGGGYEETGICPRGHYCPSGTRFATEYGCPNGTYNDVVGMDEEGDCKYCPQGRFCEFAVSSTEECERGTYMPYGASDGTTVYVRDGTGSLHGGTSAKRQFDCLDCPGGFYCGQGIWNPIPCGTGMYSKVGQYECEVCKAGHYCDNITTSEEAMLNTKRCPAGRFCVAGLHDKSSATDCSTGHYCDEATTEETRCPNGTVRKTIGAGAVTDCAPCDAGYYCLAGSSVVTGECVEGFYCPTNFSNPFNNFPPTIGSYDKEQVPCPGGTYSNVTATPDLASCLECPAGYYCGQATNQPVDCPQAYYCPTGAAKAIPCPVGTYGSRMLLKSADNCTSCDPGYYCDAPGLTQPTGMCDPGYLCYGGAHTSSPTDGVTGELCIRGGYCLIGSFIAAPCPLGTYGNVTGAVNAYDCTDCDPGYYCNTIVGTAPSGKCDAGYYCTGRAKFPKQHATEPGHFSEEGAVEQTECEIGYYAPNYSMPACAICPQGFFCDEKAMNFTRGCPAGQYCPEGSYFPKSCPPGTFSNRTHMEDITDCEDCPAGYYCQDQGLTAPTGQCKAGHICYLKAIDDDPVFNNNTAGNKTIITYGDHCHPGYYCEKGTSHMQECPHGTYRKDYGGESLDSCTVCDPGKYCNSTHLADVTGDCLQGYYCTGGAYLPDPIDNVTGNICPQHHICPTGSKLPKTCPIGYYANATGMWECQLCLAGYLCKPGEPPQTRANAEQDVRVADDMKDIDDVEENKDPDCSCV